MGDEEAAAEAPPVESEEKDKKGKKDKKTWEEKQADENKKKKDEYMPWGSDPCVKMRVKYGKVPKSKLLSNQQSAFPWYLPTRKYMDVQKEEDEKKEKRYREEREENGDVYDKVVKNNLEYIKKKSEENRKKRIWECNRKPGDEETYEQYCARKEKRERKRRQRKREEEEEEEGEEVGKNKKVKQKKTGEEKPVTKDSETEQSGEGENEGDDEGGETEENEENFVPPERTKEEIKTESKTEKEKEDPGRRVKKGKAKKAEKEYWPGQYVMTVTEDFITILKMIIEAEYETKPKAERLKKMPRQMTKKDKILNEFTSFLNVMFMANEMMKSKDKDGSNDKVVQKTQSVKSDGSEKETIPAILLEENEAPSPSTDEYPEVDAE